MFLKKRLQVRVTGAQHGGKARRFHLAAPFLAGLFKMPVIADFLQRPFPVDFLLQPAQRLIHRFAFLQLNLGQ